MRVLHVVPSFWPAVRYGGPVRTVLELCVHLRRSGVDVRVATTDADGDADLAVPTDTWVDVQGVPVRYFRRRPRTRFTISAELAHYLAAHAGGFDVLHITSLFSFPSLVAARVAAWKRVPYIVSPRGSLMPAARRFRRWKKFPYWWSVERRNVSRASAIHATSLAEAAAVRAAVPRAAILLAPNGVALPAENDQVRLHPRRILFLGRIHPLKGFDLLLPAVSRLAQTMPDVELVIAGPDEDNYRPAAEELLRRQVPPPRVTWIGPVEDVRKAELLGSAAVLVLPSKTENFGQVVVEALAVGTPVIASDQTPWEALEQAGAGRWLPRDAEVWARALREILTDEPLRQRMSSAARRLASRFSWPAVAALVAQGYEGGGHTGRIGTLALVPQAIDAAKPRIPLV
jgi:glycosyltransferase involved in cell wall biosynthesis